ncbi:twitching motility protein PilT [Bryobacterales bacterium F-183]|nr:twitching motility protein PilT [Bryobacterales bacterium F-183]
MADVVIDASLTAAWCLPDEATEETAELLKSVGSQMKPIAPTLWSYEVRNTILFALRRGRIPPANLPATLAIIDRLRVQVVEPTSFDSILMLAERHRLTVYDAAYLALAIETGLPLGTLDKALRQAAQNVGVATFAL